MSHKALDNVGVFENLLDKGATGKTPYGKIILATTMWRDGHEPAKIQREKDLQTQYWQWYGIAHGGPKILRFYDKPNSAWELIKGVDGLVV